jgi:hypothetical protein
MSSPLTVECEVHFQRGRRGRVAMAKEAVPPASSPGRVPRVSRLMALALRMEDYVRTGAVGCYSELADLGHVSRARVTQIMNLLCLAPDIQEALLFLPQIDRGRAPIILRDLQPIAAIPSWITQRRLWRALQTRAKCA